MPDLKISQLQADDTIDGSELVPLAQGTANRRATLAQIRIWVLSGLTLAWSSITGKPNTLAGYGITDAASATALANHEADATNIHGIADTSALVVTTDTRLGDARTPTGAAGGVLAGTYPNPDFAVDMATQAELNAVASAKENTGVAAAAVTSHNGDASAHGQTATGRAVLTATTEAAARAAIGTDAAGMARPPTAHNHAITDVTGLQAALDGKLGVPQYQTLADGATIAWAVASGVSAQVTLAGNRALANPTGHVAGGTYVLIVRQDATGNRTLSFGSAFRWPNGTAPTLSTGANSATLLTFVSDGALLYGAAAAGYPA